MPGTHAPPRGALAYHIGGKQSASIGDCASVFGMVRNRFGSFAAERNSARAVRSSLVSDRSHGRMGAHKKAQERELSNPTGCA